MRDWIVGLIGAAVIIAAALLISAWPAHAQTAACRTPNDLVHVYGQDDGAGFQFDKAADVAGIIAQLTMVAGPPPGKPPVLVMLTIDLDAETGDFWLYDGNGCFIAHMRMNADDVQMVLDDSKVAIPYPVPLPGTGGRGVGI